MPQHFVTPPQWEWYIVWYFFLGGLAGGAYLLGTILHLMGDERDRAVARLAFLIAFPVLAICPILLTLDLGRPLRFWHMLIDSRTFGLNFKYWSPMSVGAWALIIFSAFAFVSFIQNLLGDDRLRLLRGGFGRLFMIVGALSGLFLAGYTGVLLSVSNQPIWSDTWALGGLFLASGLSVAAAALVLLVRLLAPAPSTEAKLSRADRYFVLLELVLLVVFFLSLGAVAQRFLEPRWLVMWALVLAGTLVPLGLRGVGHRGGPAILASCLVLVGGLALRIVVIFSAQM
ncbi:MAG: NrfD/PsrC family molybdoenzyme membrane anchor subunit [Candidatus Rokuibacteriota bacterium]|jgi:formate-dependent nitrite reductase membrane component NrfD